MRSEFQQVLIYTIRSCFLYRANMYFEAYFASVRKLCRLLLGEKYCMFVDIRIELGRSTFRPLIPILISGALILCFGALAAGLNRRIASQKE